MRLEGLKRLQRKLEKMRRKAAEDEDVVVQVGYTQSYAIYVHENLENYHPVGTAKFLEMPARRHQNRIAEIVQTVVKKTGSLRDGLLRGGRFLRRESQELVPVDTSALKASAYTAFEEDADQAASQAFGISEAIRKSDQQRRRDASYQKMKNRAALQS